MARPALPPNVSGQRVRVALLEARPAGLHMPHLTMATELSRSQARRGIAYLRDTAAELGLTPLIWDRMNGYRFSSDPEDWVAYELRAFRKEMTAIRRIVTGCVIPHSLLRPDDEDVKLMLGQLTGVESGFEYLIRQLERTRKTA
ncbi:hypothetical protein [Yinghuangia sp. YIM S09857]|uniref:hypothetical protein n=1 Tax=Yinghuangia sp. YIM S09857 TaxID=3436929 RepID=UPI003F539BC1